MLDPVFARFSSPEWPGGDLEVFELEGVERISAPFSFEVTVASSASGDPAVALGRPATIALGRGKVVHREVHGIIWSIDDREELADGRRLYRVRVVPRVEALTLQVNLEVFVDVSLPELLLATLADAGLHDDEDIELRLSDKYPKRELVVQFEETDLAFVSRLCEQAGVSYFFEHQSGRDVIVFSDHNDAFPTSEPLPLRRRGERTDVFELEKTRRLVPQQYVVRDYDYKNPNLDLTATARLPMGIGGTIVEHGAHHETPEEGARIARLRAEEQLAQRVRHRAKLGDARVSAGHVFTLVDDERGDLELLPIEVRHHAAQRDRDKGDDRLTYDGSLDAITKNITFRPARVTPKPRVPGIITGHIDASVKSDYAQLDDQGRYRVRLDFDTARHEAGHGSRPIRMAQPHVGPGYGMHFPLRKGVEVVLACIGGDPERPIIVGTVPNALTPSVVDSTDSAKNVIRTGAGNEIALDDTKGSERIKITTPSGGTVFQLGSPNAPEWGAILSTDGAATTAATAGITTVGAFKTAMSAMTDFRTSGSITSIAKPVDKSNFLIVTGLLDALSTAVLASCDLIEKGYEFDKVKMQMASDDANKRAEDAQKAADKATGALDAQLKALEDDKDPSAAKLRACFARLQAAHAKRATDIKRVRRAKSQVTKESVEGEPAKVFLEQVQNELKQDEIEVEDAQKALDEEIAKLPPEKQAKLASASKSYAQSMAEGRKANDDAFVAKLSWDNWKFKDTDVGPVVGEVQKYAKLVKANVAGADAVKKMIHIVSGLFARTKTAEEKLIGEKTWARIGSSTMYASSSAISSAMMEPRWMVGGWSLPKDTVHVIGSKNSTAVYGDKNLLLWSEGIGIEASQDLFAKVGERFYLKSGKEGELRAEEKLTVVGDKKLFLYSGQEVKVESMKTFKTLTWGGATTIESHKELNLEGDSGVKVNSLKSDVTVTAQAGSISMSANRVKVDSPSQIEAKVGPSKVTLTPARIKLEVGGALLEVTATGVSVSVGGTAILSVGPSGVTVSGNA
ncbi:MAG: type VI secretion system tip protein TssI/VgrG, partial [Polyangiales bacterium]